MTDDEIWTQFVYAKGMSERERVIIVARAIERASRRAALEAAAKLCDAAASSNEAAKNDKENVTTMEAMVFAGAEAQARKSATNIRALASQGETSV